MMLSDNGIDVTFEQDPMELFLSSLKDGDTVSASELLAVLDQQGEDALEDVFAQLAAKGAEVDISDIPRYRVDSETAVRLRREEQLVKQGSLMDALEATDPLRMYLEEIARIPVCGDADILAEKIIAEPENEEVRTTVMNLFLSRVVELSCEFTGFGILLMDLIQEGSMGLWESLQEYRQGDISRFADQRIRWYLTKAVVAQACAAGVGQRLRQAVEDYRSADERLLTDLGRNPTVQEVAESLHVSVEEAQVLADTLQTVRQLNRAKQPEPEQLPQEEDQAVEDTAYFQMRQRIQELLSSLDAEDAKLLTLRYGLEGGLPLDPAMAGKQLGMTPEEVVERESAALAKLRQQN